MRLLPIPFSQGPVYAAIFWTACALWILPELVASIARRSTDSARASDRGSLLLIAVLWWFGIMAGFAISFFLPQTGILRGRIFAFVLGIGLMLGGIALRWYSARILGKYFTFDVTTQGDHVLIEVGPYRYIRHPSYAGALLTLIGFGLALGNWGALIAAVSCLSFAYIYRIRVEEAALCAALGEPYKLYMRRTRRLLPFVF